MGQVVLLILFNHKYERNLTRLREIYAGRFSHLYFIMPFYLGDEEDVITVYGNSYYFQGYIAQALQKINEEQYEHYLVIGDDLILNPVINETNYTEHFKLKPDSGFIPDVFLLHDDVTPRRLLRKTTSWFWNYNAVNFCINKNGIEAGNELPDSATARAILANHGYEFSPFLKKKDLKINNPPINTLFNLKSSKWYIKTALYAMAHNFRFLFKKQRTISYPMVGSYSDIVIIPRSAVKLFRHYAGVLASLELFVEIALPTALLLTVKEITQEKDLDKKGLTLWEADELELIEEKYHKELKLLFNNFPDATLYLHPVKLSKWK